MMTNHFLFILFLPLALVVTFKGYAKEQIIWYDTNFPPMYIKSGPFKDQGHMGAVNKFIIAHLPMYTHSTKTSNFSRILKEIKKKENACSVALLKNPQRAEFTAFSKPLYVFLSNGIIIPKKSKHKIQPHITPNGSVSLKTLLTSRELTVYIPKGRRFGQKIDALLHGDLGKGVVVERSGDGQVENILEMIKRNRVGDLTIGFPVEAKYLSRGSSNINEREFLFYPIAEIQAYSLGYVGCSKSAQGKEIINRINQMAGEVRKTYSENYSIWLDEESAISYRKILDQGVFNKN
ncbi:TIGR02285 family protein [Vibrio profundum]|uniref:TIGR02285 family protein n=1 Tax=Vibrio profundum TaxID=2910247 RepID=UPI003D11642E